MRASTARSDPREAVVKSRTYFRRLFGNEDRIDFGKVSGHRHLGLHVIWGSIEDGLPEGQ